MNKEYPLIHLNGESYMVDKESGRKTTIDYITDGEQVKLPANQTELDSPMWFKILATTDKSLSLPLLPSIEEDVISLAENAYPYITVPDKEITASHNAKQDTRRIAWIQGYKANKKKWTDEDMRNAMRSMRGYDFKHISDATFDDLMEAHMNHIKPQPIAVEVEMEKKCEAELVNCSFGRGKDCDCEIVPKVDQNNFVIVKRWIFNEK